MKLSFIQKRATVSPAASITMLCFLSLFFVQASFANHNVLSGKIESISTHSELNYPAPQTGRVTYLRVVVSTDRTGSYYVCPKLPERTFQSIVTTLNSALTSGKVVELQLDEPAVYDGSIGILDGKIRNCIGGVSY